MNQEIKKYMVTLETLEPFRIGAPEDPMLAAHNPLSMVGKSIVVPGSSLKGALRAEIESYLIKNYASEKYMKPCIPSAFNTMSPAEKALIRKGNFKEGGGCAYSERSKSECICPVCYLLGAQGLIGFVRVPYLYTEESAEKLYSVRIDRASGVVSERTNRDYRIIPHGTKFASKVNGKQIPLEIVTNDPVKKWELSKPREGFNDKWLGNSKWTPESLIKEFIVDRLQSIEVLGGFKSKGCGKVSIEATEV